MIRLRDPRKVRMQGLRKARAERILAALSNIRDALCRDEFPPRGTERTVLEHIDDLTEELTGDRDFLKRKPKGPLH